MAAAIALLYAQAMCDLALPDYMSDLINKGILNRDLTFLAKTGMIMLLIVCLGAACSVTVSFISSRVAAGLGRRLRKDVYTKVGTFSNIEFDRFTTSSLITRTTNDITQIQTMMVFLIRLVFYAPIMAIGALLHALDTNANMTWIIALAVSIMSALITFAIVVAVPKFKIIQSLIDKLNLVVRENLDGMLVIRAFNTQTFEENRFDNVNKELTNTNLFVNRTMALMMPTIMIVMNLITVLIVWVGSNQVSEFKMDVGSMMAYMQYVMQVLMSFMMMSMMFIMLPRAAVSANRIADVLETEPSITDNALLERRDESMMKRSPAKKRRNGRNTEIRTFSDRTNPISRHGGHSNDAQPLTDHTKVISGEHSLNPKARLNAGLATAALGYSGGRHDIQLSSDHSNAVPEHDHHRPGAQPFVNQTNAALGPEGELEFRNVSFAYPDAQDMVLNNVSFIAKPGETTVIIGSTGSGKSTIVNLIPRFYDVTAGDILINGISIRAISLKELRRQLGFTPQKSVLFSGSIRSNLEFADQDASVDDLWLAAEISQATEFIEANAEGIDAEISQGGTNVSGGQRQRLSIARALVRKPQFYIFDDSFSALDFKTDMALRTALKRETGGSTVITVTQRVSTAMNAEKIIVMDHGKVVGCGKHRELLGNCSVYQEIAYSQLSEEDLA